MGKHLSIFWVLLLVGFSVNAYARGGVGGSPSVLFAVVIVFGIGGLGFWLHETYPNLFPTIGGLVILLVVSQFLAAILVGLGVVPQAYIAHAMVIIALAFVFGPMAWSRIRGKP
ncbi:hypothetical protein ACPF7Z_09355 [Halomonas sp. GXIMD04776]|uniref:hypothetical protein n=1 Tax=Halomonas sp. GXIMD04776 TaxID=3415605 RepID=UPI003CA38027